MEGNPKGVIYHFISNGQVVVGIFVHKNYHEKYKQYAEYLAPVKYPEIVSAQNHLGEEYVFLGVGYTDNLKTEALTLGVEEKLKNEGFIVLHGPEELRKFFVSRVLGEWKDVLDELAKY